MIKRWLKILLKSFFIILSAWLVWLLVTAKPAPDHPFHANETFSTIGHRGGGGTKPENTLQAFLNSDQLGIDILEMDIRLSKDRHIILFHDRTLSRTTNCDGLVSEYTLKQLRECTMRQGSSGKGSNTTLQDSGIPTLNEVFDHFPDKRMIIEIKGSEPQLITDFCTMLHRYNKDQQVLVGAFRQSTLDQFRQVCPKVATAATAREGFRFYLVSKLRLTGLLAPEFTSLIMPWRFTSKEKNKFFFMDIFTPSFIKQAHNKNLAVYVFTVNDPEDMKILIDLGVDGIMTASPEVLLSVAQ